MMLLKSDFIEEFILKKREDIAACQDQLLMGEEEREAFPSFWDCECLFRPKAIMSSPQARVLTTFLTSACLSQLHRRTPRSARDRARPPAGRASEQARTPQARRPVGRHHGRGKGAAGHHARPFEVDRSPTAGCHAGRGEDEEKSDHPQTQGPSSFRKGFSRITDLTNSLCCLQIEAKLLQALPAWEKDHQRPFCINGERIIETIQATLDAKQAAKDLKQVRFCVATAR